MTFNIFRKTLLVSLSNGITPLLCQFIFFVAHLKINSYTLLRTDIFCNITER